MYREENRRYLEQLFGTEGITCILSKNYGHRLYELVLADGLSVERTAAPFIDNPERFFQRKVTLDSFNRKLRVGHKTLPAFTRPIIQKFLPSQKSQGVRFWLLEVRPRQWLRLYTFWNPLVLNGIVSLNDIDSIKPDLSSSAAQLVMSEVVKFLLSTEKEKRSSSRVINDTRRPLAAESQPAVTVTPEQGTDENYDAEDVCLEDLAEMTPRLPRSFPSSDDVNDAMFDVFMSNDQHGEVPPPHDVCLPLLSSVELLDQLSATKQPFIQTISVDHEGDYAVASSSLPPSSFSFSSSSSSSSSSFASSSSSFASASVLPPSFTSSSSSSTAATVVASSLGVEPMALDIATSSMEVTRQDRVCVLYFEGRRVSSFVPVDIPQPQELPYVLDVEEIVAVSELLPGLVKDTSPQLQFRGDTVEDAEAYCEMLEKLSDCSTTTSSDHPKMYKLGVCRGKASYCLCVFDEPDVTTRLYYCRYTPPLLAVASSTATATAAATDTTDLLSKRKVEETVTPMFSKRRRSDDYQPSALPMLLHPSIPSSTGDDFINGFGSSSHLKFDPTPEQVYHYITIYREWLGFRKYRKERRKATVNMNINSAFPSTTV